MDKISVLIIEDDPFLVEMYVEKLEQSGFDVEFASDGEEGLEKANSINPDVILLDIVLPKADGFEVLEDIRKNPDLKNTIVILLTNLGQRSNVKKGLEMGADEYIIKAHFTPTSVVVKIKEIINKHKNRINERRRIQKIS